MGTSKLLAATASSILMAASLHAVAADTVYGTDFGNGSSYTTTINGTNVTFSAKTGSNQNQLANGIFSYKPGQGGYQGVGVSPAASVCVVLMSALMSANTPAKG